MNRKDYVLGLENLPGKDENFFIVSNHQSAANDPINIAFSLPKDRRIGFMTRADAFNINAQFSKLIRWLGLVPVFRAGWEGTEALEKNNESFDEFSKKVSGGMPIVVFPEGTHAQGHYLLPLSTGAARMAFHVAEFCGWKEDVKIVPVAHHYEEYFDIQHDFMLTIGKPISLMQYYEEYQKKPYTVLRRVKHAMEDQIRGMMLDVGEADFETKEFLRKTLVNDITRLGRKLPLPERLKADKEFCKKINESANYSEIIALGNELQEKERQLKINDRDTLYAESGKGAQIVSTIASVLLDLVLLPLWIPSLWPNLLCYRLPLILLKTDVMFTNTFRYILNVLVLYPLTTIITAILIGIFTPSWWFALAYLLLCFPITLFSWYEGIHIQHTIHRFRILKLGNEIKGIEVLRKKIKELI